MSENKLIISNATQGVQQQLPGVKATADEQVKSFKLYAEITKKIQAENPEIKFDYSSYPFLNVVSNKENIAVILHPSLKDEYSSKYDCNAGIYQSAFSDKVLLDKARNSLRVAGVYSESLEVNRRLEDIDFKVKASEIWDKVKKFEAKDSDFKYVNSLGRYADDFESMGNVPVAKITGPEDKIDNDLKAQKSKLAEAISNNINDTASQNRMNSLVGESEKRVQKQATHNLTTEDWFHKKLQEYGYFLREETLKNKIPGLDQRVVVNENNSELFRVAPSGNSIVMNKSALLDAKAVEFATKTAIKNGIRPAEIKMTKNILEKADNNNDLNDNLGKYVEMTAKHFFDAGYKIDEIIVPERFERIIKRLADEYANTPVLAQGEAKPEEPMIELTTGQKPAEPTPTVSPDAVPTSVPAAAEPTPETPVQTPAPAPSAFSGDHLRLVKNDNHYLLIADSQNYKQMSVEDLKSAITELAKEAGIEVADIKGAWKNLKGEQTLPEIKKAEAEFLSKYPENEQELAKQILKDTIRFDSAKEALYELKNPQLAEVVKHESKSPSTDFSEFLNEKPSDRTVTDKPVPTNKSLNDDGMAFDDSAVKAVQEAMKTVEKPVPEKKQTTKAKLN